MYDYYDQYVKASGDADAQERWSNQFRWEVARHAVGEELVVYPLMEKHLGAKGKELADHDRADHEVSTWLTSLCHPKTARRDGNKDGCGREANDGLEARR